MSDILVKIADIAELITKGTTPTTLGYDFREEGVNFLKIECFNEDGKYIPNKVAYISEECNDKLKRSQLENGDILFSIAGAIGRVAIVTEEMLPANTNQALAIIRIKNKNVYLPYIKLILTSSIVKEQIERKKQGVAQLNLSLKDVGELTVPMPKYDKQIEYVELFTKIENIINGKKLEIEELNNLIKSRFIELFGDPEDTTTKWERTIFSSVCMDMHQGINTVADKVEYVNSGFPIIQSKNITSGYLDLEDVRYVTESDYEYYRNKYNPKPSDLLVCNIGTIGKSLIVESEVDFLIAWNLFLIKLNKELVNPIFIKVFIELLNQQNYFEKYMTGGTVKFVNKKTMGSISTPLPPMELQEQFAVFVEQTDKLKVEVRKSLDEMQKLLDSLMQKYFG